MLTIVTTLHRLCGEAVGALHRSLLGVTRRLGLKGQGGREGEWALAAWKQRAGLGDLLRFFPTGDSTSLTSHIRKYVWQCLMLGSLSITVFKHSWLENPSSARLTDYSSPVKMLEAEAEEAWFNVSSEFS